MVPPESHSISTHPGRCKTEQNVPAVEKNPERHLDSDILLSTVIELSLYDHCSLSMCIQALGAMVSLLIHSITSLAPLSSP